MKIVRSTKPRFFATPADFRAWLEKNHATAPALVVGFYKRDSGKPSITWPESVDEALCFGWIDGIRHRVDDEVYTIRFTPRRPKGIWSSVNTRRYAVLTKEGRMTRAGVTAFEARDPKKTAMYSFERKPMPLSQEYEEQLRRNAKAWAYFETAAPYYKRMATLWVMTAKNEETRQRRLAHLIESAAKRTKIGPARPGKSVRKDR